MDGGAPFDRLGDALFRRQGAELEAIGVEDRIGAEQHALARAAVVAAWIADIADRQIGRGDAAEDRLVLLPETALKLQADLDAGDIGHRGNRRRHLRTDIHLDLAEDRQRDGAEAPIGARLHGHAARRQIVIGHGDAMRILVDRAHLGVIADEVADLANEALGDHVHAADRLEQRRLKLVDAALHEPLP